MWEAQFVVSYNNQHKHLIKEENLKGLGKDIPVDR
jgi:hypothetical protein